MKKDQIAYYAHDEAQVQQIKEHWGLSGAEWIEDEATGNVRVRRAGGRVVEGESTGILRFNYDLGIELEILTYTKGPHWHMDGEAFRNGRPFLSHIGYHMDEGEQPPDKRWQTVQEMWTTNHTNPYLIEQGRKYHYLITDTLATLGHYSKYIWRIQENAQ